MTRRKIGVASLSFGDIIPSEVSVFMYSAQFCEMNLHLLAL